MKNAIPESLALSAFHAVIPARRHSTRLPDKPLADIGGAPMVVRVAERALRSGATSVHIATDDVEIAAVCRERGFSALMTRADHVSGTDRIAEAVAQLALGSDEIVVNVQGDEPLIDPSLVREVAHLLAKTTAADIATASHPISEANDFINPNVVKVVCDGAGLALYFSRAPIPFPRAQALALASNAVGVSANLLAPDARRHVGIYAYRVGFLARYSTLSVAPAEQTESLEQLRAMHHGYRIAVLDWTGTVAPGVDTAEDLHRVRELWGAVSLS
ncbi:MAG: 3-deoxy-manno-octulosonate cytidylyltransferase [Burkholderiales bacterium]|jgi:3-deoxy-manno-octulosonate cytidylyltransferase (CMP-KDO synthetase)|nr:3-deoxy-manno-octulosonate cytidylyltransferase [Nitrosomonadaceae bacterium]